MACAVALSIHARPLPVRGEGAEPLPERTYSNAAAILEHVVTSLQGNRDTGGYGTLSDAAGILHDLADEPVTDPASRARCAALLVPLLTNQQTGYDVAVLLQELPHDFLDKHHAELYQFLAATPRDFEDVICVYAILPSCDVTFATNKAHQMQSWLLMRDAILARHGDTAALARLQHAASTYAGEEYSSTYLSRVLSLVRTKPMVEFLLKGLRNEDVIDLAGGMKETRWSIYYEALRRMFLYEPGFPRDGSYLDYEAWIAARCGITLPKNRPLRKELPNMFIGIPEDPTGGTFCPAEPAQ